jgi:hypothetical protein
MDSSEYRLYVAQLGVHTNDVYPICNFAMICRYTGPTKVEYRSPDCGHAETDPCPNDWNKLSYQASLQVTAMAQCADSCKWTMDPSAVVGGAASGFRILCAATGAGYWCGLAWHAARLVSDSSAHLRYS